MSNINKIKNGVIWSAIDKISLSAIQLLLNLILARLIVPEEYALVAMINIFIAIGQTFVDSGFSQSLIHKQNRTHTDFSTVFFFNIIVSSSFYLIIYFAAPLIANFYDNLIFIPLTRVVAINIVVSSFAIVQRAILTIRTDFRTQAIISLVSIILSGVIGIYLAYKGFGVWAMVTQTLSYHIFSSILLWLIVRWRPSIEFSKTSFKELFSYGSKLLISRLINTVCQNLHTIVIGKYYSRSEVAYFNNANQISLYSAGYLNDIIQRALFPIQCEMQNDVDKSKSYYFRMMRLSCFVIFPIMVCVITLAKPFVLSVLTEKWAGMISYLQIVAFAYMWYPLMSSNQMFNVLGRTDLYLKNEIIKKVFFFIIVVITLFIDVKAMCYGIVAYNFLEIIITVLLLKKIMDVSFTEIIRNISTPLFLSLIMGLLIVALNYFISSNILSLLIGGCVGILTYVSLNLFFKTQDIKDIIRIINTKSN